MYHKTFITQSLFYLCLLASSLSLQAQHKPEDQLPRDTAVTVGKLANGLTYYIRPNGRPEKKLELRLVLNAGSINEDADQLGLAHMAEHMAFNGTKNFRKNEIVSFLQEIGVGFGSDLNAQTGFDETIYILPIPTDKPGNLEKGFQVLEDWAHHVTYLAEDIDGERAIILEESRSGKGAGERMFNKILPELFKGSLYAERLPIGKDSIIKNFKHETLRRFYRDWYRPNLMAVVVVGDITTARATELIKKHFGGLVNPQKQRERKEEQVPPYAATAAMVVTDGEATNFQAAVEYPAQKSQTVNTYGDYRKRLTRQLFTTMLNKRLQELTQQANPPFVFANAAYNDFARGFENFEIFAGSGDKEPSGALKAALEEVERAKRFGFTEAELERTKKNLLAGYEKSYNDRDKTESSSFVEEYIDHFLTGNAIPGIATEYELVKQLLPAISLQDVNAETQPLKGQQNLFSFIMGPERNDVKLPAPSDLKELVAAVEKTELKPYEEKEIASELLHELPQPGSVKSKKQNATLGTTELVLSNGITVTLKPTDFKNDEILMAASRHGGTSNYGKPDKYNANYALQVINSMGYGDFSPTDLQKALAGKAVGANSFIGATSEGINGSATVKDLETMFQLTYLKLTSPRKDSTLFLSFTQRNKAQLALLGANPQAAFIDTIFRVFYNDNPLAPINVPKAAFFDSIQLSRVIEIYRERLADMSGMHFVFTGSFREPEIIPLIEKYIASLPSSGKKFTYVDQKVRPVNGAKEITVYKGAEQKSLILDFYHGEVPYNDDLAFRANVLNEVLNIRIIEELREKIQGIYGGAIFGGLDKTPYPSFQFAVQLPCGPEKVDTLLVAMNNEIAAIIKNGPSQQVLDKVKQQMKESNKVQLKENGAWSARLLASQTSSFNMDRFINREKYINALTVKSIREAAAILLNGKNRFTAILMPADAEKK
ncbi:MAG: insulinase family protein [Chitinophagaceae bacterium]|nr:insulinase family protein [Chitinophagaceae bacterium]MCW5926148.1 insulinase family protein [Chitinophagaceae bacterium]